MRILLVNATAYPQIGGVENSLHYIAQALLSEGHEVKIFCFQFTPGEPLSMDHAGVEIIRYPCKNERWPHKQYISRVKAAELGISNFMGGFRPNAVWSRNVSVGVGIRRSGYKGPLLQIFPTNAKMNCKGAFLQTTGLPLSRRLILLGLWPFAYAASRYFEQELSGQCTSVTFSENMRKQLLKGFPQKKRACYLIRPGVDGKIFSPENGYRFFEIIERLYGLSRKEPIVLYVGRLSCAKHLPMLMNAISMLRTTAKLVLVGSGPEEKRLKEYVRNMGIAGQVIFAGSHYKMLPGFYSMSRVCVLPTTIESFGQVYIESLAAGTPVVGFGGDGSSILTATDEIIADGKTGVIVKDISSEALSHAIDSILALGDEEYKVMSAYCRDDTISRFSWKQFVIQGINLSKKDPAYLKTGYGL